jgi:uncharacterized protein
MKKLFPIFLSVLLLPLIVSAYTSPGKPQGFVSDFAGIISSSDVPIMESQLKTLSDTTGIEIAVVTVNSLYGDEIETYAVKLFQEWRIGDKDVDNGLLVIVAPNEREARIEVGYGLEGTVTDIQANNIVEQVMLPNFRADNYSKGIKDSVDVLVGIINKTVDPSIYSEPKKGSDSNINFEIIIFLLFVFINIFGHALSKTKSWWLGGVIGAVIGVIVSIFVGFLFYGLGVIIVLTILGLIFDFVVSKAGPKGPGGHGGFWFGGGGHGGGGGFGGFGGGMSGGGGASGRW